MSTFFLIGFLVLFLYALFAMLVTWGILKPEPDFKSVPAFPVSIIVAYRNEAKNLATLLTSFAELNYPKDLMEIVLVDDDSMDQSQQVINNFIVEHPHLNILKLESAVEGKKEAIKFGVLKARNKIILQTDADCKVPKNWIDSMTAPFVNEKVKMVAGPVYFRNLKSLFAQLQSVEFASLVASSIGLSQNKIHVMCNAANLAFSKEAYNATRFVEKSASGDDVFLMQHLSAKSREAVYYVKSKNAAVTSKPQKNVFDLLNQRKRWASKTKEYVSIESKILAVFIAAINAMELLAFSFLFFLPTTAMLVLIFVGIKTLLDFLMIQSYFAKVLNKKLPWAYFLIQSFINPFYILVVFILSQTTSYSWKGRKF